MQTAPAAAPSSTPADPLPEREVIARIAAGDRAAFAWLMRRYNQKLYRTARSILKDDAEAEDAVQEAYLRAFTKLSTYKPTGHFSEFLGRSHVGGKAPRTGTDRVSDGDKSLTVR